MVPTDSLREPWQEELYGDVSNVVLTEDEWCSLPRPCHRIQPEDETSMQNELLERHMVRLVEMTAVPRNTEGVSPHWRPLRCRNAAEEACIRDAE